jgi:hypothetical protein
VPKKPRTGQNKHNRRKGGHPRQASRQGRRTTHMRPKYNRNKLEAAQGTTSSAMPQEKGQTKRPVIQTGGVCKNMKAHRMPPEYTITEDDADMVAQMIQDHTIEDFENVVCQRDIIEEELAHIRQLLR